MNWKTYEDIATKYFHYFNNQDLESLSSLFDENITLKDWLSEYNGKQQVIDAASTAFSTLQKIQIKVKNIYEMSLTGVACEIDIHVVDNESASLLEVVDVIDINNEGKITEIRAYILNP